MMELEYLTPGYLEEAGTTAQRIAQLEYASHSKSQTGVIGAAVSRFPETTQIGSSLFYNGVWKKHGIWYVFANYAKMKGQRASVINNGNVKAVGSIDSASHTVCSNLAATTETRLVRYVRNRHTYLTLPCYLW